MRRDQDDMWQDFVVPDPNGLDIAFHGVCLADVTTHALGTVRLYQTRAGRIVLRQRHSSRPGVVRIDRTEVHDTIADALATFPPGPGLNPLREALGLATTIDIA